MRRQWLWVQARRVAATAAIVAGLGASIATVLYEDFRSEGPSATYPLAQLTTPVHAQVRVCTSVAYIDDAEIEFEIAVSAKESQDFTLPVTFVGVTSGDASSAELSLTVLKARFNHTVGPIGRPGLYDIAARCSEWFGVEVGPLTGSAGVASVSWTTAATASIDSFDVPDDADDSDLVWIEVAE